MKQTMLAFLAMSIFSLLSISQQRVALRFHGMVYGRDIEMAATDLVMTQIGRIQSLPFDEADVNLSRRGNPRNNIEDLTPRENLGPEFNLEGEPDLDDIDDYNGYQASIQHPFNGVIYSFDMSIRVRYKDLNNLTLLQDTTYDASVSLAKELTVSVKESDIPEERPRVSIEVRRIFSPAELRYH
jgi:hypothetical protein